MSHTYIRARLLPYLAVWALTLASLSLVSAQTDSAQRLRIASGGEAISLDPRVVNDVPSLERAYTMLEPLIAFDRTMSLVPRLAESWEFSDDGLQLTFRLRPGVMFHHGRELEAADVAYTYLWVLDEDNDSPHRAMFTSIASIDTPDPLTVVFQLSDNNAFILNNVARLPIVPADLGDDEDFAQAPIGTGPFRFSSWTRDDRLLLEAFPDYWGGAPELAALEFRPIPESATRLLALEGGQIDIFQGAVPAEDLPRLEQDDSLSLQRVSGLGYNYLAFNMRREPLDNVLVRQAISHLLDREAIVARVFGGVGEPGISMIAPQLPWFNEEVIGFPYDPERAAELIAQAGIDPSEVSIGLHSNENTQRVQILEILAFELERLGFNANILIEETGALFDRLDALDFDIYLFNWTGQIDPDQAMFRQFHSQGPINDSGYANPEVDALLEQGRITPPDSEESIAIYRELQRIIVNDVPYAFINYTEVVAVHQNQVQNWEIHPYGPAAFQDAHLISLAP